MSTTGGAFRRHHRSLTNEFTDRAVAIVDGRPDADPEGLVAFLKDELLTHAAGEEQHLYPAVEPLLKAHGMATATMRIDHRFIEDYVRRIEQQARELKAAAPGDRSTLRAQLTRLVLQLQAIFQMHLEKEERIYLPLFEQYISAEDQQRVLDRMHGAPGGEGPGETALDVREIPPARRHSLIFQTFESLAPSQAFTLINDHDPKPLFYQFQAERTGQFTWEYLEQGPGTWRVRIGRLA
jgi:uncharacterized protein (DUF2249 family)/iron-sulfur cluster repair protein YtfE (RIC family)